MDRRDFSPKSNENDFVLSMTRAKSGMLSKGSGSGTSCECATPSMILSCLLEQKPLDDPYSAILNSCQDDVLRALQNCCLSGYTPVAYNIPFINGKRRNDLDYKFNQGIRDPLPYEGGARGPVVGAGPPMIRVGDMFDVMNFGLYP